MEKSEITENVDIVVQSCETDNSTLENSVFEPPSIESTRTASRGNGFASKIRSIFTNKGKKRKMMSLNSSTLSSSSNQISIPLHIYLYK